MSWAMESDWRIEQGAYGPRMTLLGLYTGAASVAARDAGVRELVLNYALGWRRSSIEFIRDFVGLLSLEITDWNLGDDSAVMLSRGLRRLKLFTCSRAKLDFATWPELESCALEWRPGARSLFGCVGLRDLFLNRYTGKNLVDFSELGGLKSLSLKGAKLHSLLGVEALRDLAKLELYGARGLRGLEGMEGLLRLERLELVECGRIQDLGPLEGLHHLRELFLMDLGVIRSLAPLRELVGLERVVFTGSTNIEDGDLSVLLKLPRIKRAAFVDRAHYSHSASEFE